MHIEDTYISDGWVEIEECSTIQEDFKGLSEKEKFAGGGVVAQ